MFLSVNFGPRQLGLDPPGHGETGPSQREELPPSDRPGLHRYCLPSSLTLSLCHDTAASFTSKVFASTASLFYAPPLACPSCPRPARHLPPEQRRAEDPGELGAAPARADEQIRRPASQLHQHLPHRPERGWRPGHTATQGHAGARQHTLQVGHLLPPTCRGRNPHPAAGVYTGGISLILFFGAVNFGSK